MKTPLILALAAASTLFVGANSRAQTVSVNLVQNLGNNNQQIDVGETFGIASLGTVTGGWTNLNADANNLLNNLGTATTVNISLAQPNGQATFNNAYTNTPLFAGLDDYTTTTTPVSITLSGLDATYASGYFAIVYVGGFNANTGASITDGTTTYYYRPDPAPVSPYGTFAQTSQTTDLGSGNNPIAQYAVFGSPSTPLSADSVTFTMDTLYGGGSGLCGVQLVAAPEPASATIALMGGVGLMILWRRGRNRG